MAERELSAREKITYLGTTAMLGLLIGGAISLSSQTMRATSCIVAKTPREVSHPEYQADVVRRIEIVLASLYKIPIQPLIQKHIPLRQRFFRPVPDDSRRRARDAYNMRILLRAIR